jgi:methionine synthase II (cobalamin-independent)
VLAHALREGVDEVPAGPRVGERSLPAGQPDARGEGPRPGDLQPVGWRLVDRPGGDAARTAALWREDLDELAEAFDGHEGPLKVQVAGPWTLASSVWLTRGERAVVDEGARRDLVDSLAEGVRQHVAAVRRLVPGAKVVLQVDEPSLPAALAGRLPTASGFGMLRALDPQEGLRGLQTVLAAHDGDTIIHCCAANPPLELLRAAEPGALSVDATLLGARGWEGLAVAVESGIRLHPGLVPTDGSRTRAQDLADALVEPWHRVGMPLSALADVVVTPTCGLAGASPQGARSILRAAVETAVEISERAAG